jgi:hypothetical protein
MRRGIIIFLMVATFVAAANGDAKPALVEGAQKQMVMTNLSAMALAFTGNRGQWDEKVVFRAEAGGAVFFFCDDEVVYVFTRDTNELMYEGMSQGLDISEMPVKLARPRYKRESMVIRTQFVGANAHPQIVAENRLSHNYNYFYGDDPSRWVADVPSYESITYKDLWPGIDLRYHGDGRGMKYDFIVNPGADVSQIRIRYNGVDDLSITNQGDLRAESAFGLVYEKIPAVYQQIDGRGMDVAGQYVIVEPGVFGFELAEGYNPAYPLVIDPELVFSTYLGGNGDDWGRGIAVDGAGNAYVTGWTLSTNFPTQNPYQTDQPDWDIFVSKLSSAGNSLIYSSYLGGSNVDLSWDIAVDTGGNAYVTGGTHSLDFPTNNPYQNNQTGVDVFVSKLSSAGNSLIYSTYLGGNGDEEGSGIAVDAGGNAYVTGYTGANDFPTENPYQTNQPYVDDFVSKLSSAGNSLIFSTYLGGDEGDWSIGIAVDDWGNSYVTGYTSSSNFPVENPYQAYQGNYDAFVSRFSSAGNSLIYSTYLGGYGFDGGGGIAVDGRGSAYVTGWTASGNFPTENPYQTNQPGDDAFVSKLSSAGNSLVYSTYLGGNAYDEVGWGIAVDGGGSAYITGWTASTDFPTENPYQTDQPGVDVFVSRLSSAGNSLLFGTYLGGNGDEGGMGIAIDAAGNTYVTGRTWSTDFPTENPYQTDLAGGSDVFVSKFAPEPGDCVYLPGDVDHNGTPLEINDVVAMIAYYRGDTGVAYTCDCPPHGSELAVTADPNGNCVPLELADVVAEIGAYGGSSEVSGCPDCPGSLR